jgi:ankyrin repeat protein
MTLMREPEEEDELTPIDELTDAIWSDSRDEAISLITSGLDLNDCDRNLVTPLMMAVMQEDVELAEMMIEHGARPRRMGTRSPLDEAVNKDNADLVLLMIKAGAPVNEIGYEGYTPLTRAARFGLEDVMGVLLKEGAEPEAVDGNGHTAHQLTVEHGHTECRRLVSSAIEAAHRQAEEKAAVEASERAETARHDMSVARQQHIRDRVRHRPLPRGLSK